MGLPRRAGSVVAAAAALLLAAGCGGSRSAPSSPPPQQTPFSYDASQPLAFRDAGRLNASYPIAVRDVSYAVPGGRINGYLAVPPSGRKLPAVLYLHGSGGGRGELLVPAVWFAGRRAVGLTISSPSSVAGPQPRGLTPAQSLARDRRLTVADVIAARRAVDLLRSLPQVDPARIAVAGWSLGARTTAILAGVEPRIRAYVLMSGGASPVSTYVAEAPARLRPEVRRVLSAIDPLRWIARGRPGTILLQDGRKDAVVPRAALLTLAHAAPRGTELRWYPTPHDLSVAAYRYQLDWLSRHLGVRGPHVPGAKTGP
jgi:dienelactone hydrolase